ncbi:MAG TPA: AmmeMemoRadiSam system protein B [Burkholderiales bacterium]|nr:AmmeMemoRadiSam system protein B [Burkholderiales bacterium]
MTSVRTPAVAGAFYPGAATALEAQVTALLAAATTRRQRRPKALIAPHAGYLYSGPVAANAYALLAPFRNDYSRVVMLGPAHRVHVRGLALPAADAFATPLGEIALDREAIAGVRHLPQVCISDDVHAHEHSLEVHLPFLQHALAGFTLVPLAVGEATAEQVAEVLGLLWGNDRTLIVVSSDLSHYLPYAQARMIDEHTARMVLDMAPKLNHEQACGATPVNGLLLEARDRGLHPELLDLRNSGDTAGDKSRVVGYASFAFYGQPPARETQDDEHDRADGRVLVSIARSAIASSFGIRAAVQEDAPFLHRPGASFVTLTSGNRLRGCIGSVQAHRTLVEDVKANARAAAFHDPRFAPLAFDELPTTKIEVSLLSALLPLAFRNEEHALEQLRPGEDGVVLEFKHHRSTFLPQVWATLPSPAAFLNELKRKAGLPLDFWDDGIRLFRYSVSKWAESEKCL